MYVPWLFVCLFRGIGKNVNVDTVDVVLRLRCCAMVDIQSAQAQKHVKRVGRRRISLINACFEEKKKREKSVLPRPPQLLCGSQC
jgi:hypothetical protein